MPDTPLRLNVVASLVFPDGSMTAAGLRREGARGKLIIERIAGKDYTTLANIDRMRELCRVEVRERACGCENPNMTRPVNSRTRQSGSSRTGATEKARDAALRIAEGEYIARQHLAQAESGLRPPAAIPVADVLSLYGRDIAPKHARRGETGQRITALLSFFGDKFLSDINGQLCRAYVEHRGSEGAARRELEDLRAASTITVGKASARRSSRWSCPMPGLRASDG
ncbi:MAG TPA: hypothetical protein VGI22_08920 [Xanthobacteraceae bacterium]|jgi:hypothetical protein